MGKAYSEDLRTRMVGAVVSGKSRRAVAAQFEVAPSTVIELQKRFAATGSVEPARQGRPKGSGKLGPFEDAIIEKVKRQSDITMPDLAAWLEARHGVIVDPSNLSKLLRRAGFTYKETLLASEKERSDVKQVRRVWIEQRQPFMRARPGRLIFMALLAHRIDARSIECSGEAVPRSWVLL